MQNQVDGVVWNKIVYIYMRDFQLLSKNAVINSCGRSARYFLHLMLSQKAALLKWPVAPAALNS